MVEISECTSLPIRGGKQKILAAMKRVKLSGDFRSNVSLGATAEPIKLTKEQEKIALETAKVSKLPWCAVDIMPLVENSNPELGDNVVLEINASPGTEGISEVIKENSSTYCLTTSPPRRISPSSRRSPVLRRPLISTSVGRPRSISPSSTRGTPLPSVLSSG